MKRYHHHANVSSLAVNTESPAEDRNPWLSDPWVKVDEKWSLWIMNINLMMVLYEQVITVYPERSMDVSSNLSLPYKSPENPENF